jgi:hypothetical protein
LRRDKPQDGRAFLGATYTSDDEEDEDEDKVVGMASLALASSDSLFNQEYSKDYGSSSSSFTCLMAREAKVTTSTLSQLTLTNDEIINDDDDVTAHDKLIKFCASTRGVSRSMFKYLMDLVYETEDAIRELSTLLEEEDMKSNLLEQELEIEKESVSTLSQSIDMYELDKAKTLYNLDEALKLSQELDASKKELEVAHANLSKDFEHLEKNRSLLKGGSLPLE